MARRKLTAKVETIGPDRCRVTYGDGTTSEMATHVFNVRMLMIKSGLEFEMGGMKLTAKAPSCYTIIREEFGIRGRDKLPRYFTFCHLIGKPPADRILSRGDNFQAYADWCAANDEEQLVKVALVEAAG